MASVLPALHSRGFREIATLSLFLLGVVRGLSPSAQSAEPDWAEQARAIHKSAILVDGHNDLPWWLRSKGDYGLKRYDLRKGVPEAMTDIPRLRAGGVKAQFWSVFIPHDHPNPARTVFEQIDLVHRLIDKYPDVFALALTADDVERLAGSGKIASLIGMEGGVAIEENFALLRAFHRQGARYMTLTHNTSLAWADAATDDARSDGLSPFGERVVREMNRLGMLVDISHVSAATMKDVLRISKAPVIASHSSAFAIAPHPRNVPDDVLKLMPANGGVIMVNFYSGFVVGSYARESSQARAELKAKHPDPADFAKALSAWRKSHPAPRGTIQDVADHVEHIIQVAGIDHVGLGSDYDGINSTPEGLEDVSCFPKLTAELLKRGRSEADLRKLLGGNLLRAFRRAEMVAVGLQSTTEPQVDSPHQHVEDE